MCDGAKHSDHHEHGYIRVPAVSRRSLLRVGGLGLGAALLAACGRGHDSFQERLDNLGKSVPSTTTSSVEETTTTMMPPTTTTEHVVAEPTTTVGGSSVVVMPSGFDEFVSTVRVTKEGSWWLVESNGVPAHGMMKGIKSWQQQVPVAQPYSGANAWRIPAVAVLADTPVSARTALYRGAIALAANGVPIFNALNNRGDDAYVAGELDEWGGHCGRADDYHYHVAPLHLSGKVGREKPIAWALDGFPVFGETEPDGTKVSGLDSLNGHDHGALGYHYHGTRTYPYINGGLRGIVRVEGDQIEPQPRTNPFRPAGEPLRGATITDFMSPATGSYILTYALDGKEGEVAYTVAVDSVKFRFTSPDGTVTNETYVRNG